MSIVKDGPTTINEGGDTATFAITITNDGNTDRLSITSLTDDKFGNLLAEAEAAWVAAGNTAPLVLSSGESFSFSFDRDLVLDADEAHTNVVTVVGTNSGGETATAFDRHTVTGENVAPAVSVVKEGEAVINEGGDTATFDVTITSNSVITDPLTITSLTDDKFGDLLAEAEAAWVAAGNTAPIVLQSGDSFSFSFDRDLELNVGETHVNVMTVVGTDDEGTTATAQDNHTVTATDVSPVITVIKGSEEGLDLVGTVGEREGGAVTFPVAITSQSVSTDPVTITAIMDKVVFDTNGNGIYDEDPIVINIADLTDPNLLSTTCGSILGYILDPGETVECEFTVSIEPNNPWVDPIDIVTVSGTDDEETTVTASDDAKVDIAQENQRSIEVHGLTAQWSADKTVMVGTYMIDDASEDGNRDELDVLVTATNVTFETKERGQIIRMNPDTYTCSYEADLNGDGSSDLIQDPNNAGIIFGESIMVSYSCTILGEGETWPNKIEITAFVVVSQGNRPKEVFLYRDSFEFDKKNRWLLRRTAVDF
jgi:hypothetical protein